MDQLDAHILTDIVARSKPSVQRICQLSVLSRRFKEACYSRLLWQKLLINGSQKGNLYGEGLVCIAGRCKEVKSLELCNVHIMERPNPWMHHTLEQILAAASDTLEVLRMEFAWELPFTDKLLAIVGRLCPNLVDFKISAANYFMTDAALSIFLRACTKIRHFSCYVRSASPIHAPGDTVLWQIAKKWPHLISLEINGNHVSENGIYGLEECRDLKVLSFHGYNRGVFDRAKSTADGQLVVFDNLSTVTFTYQLPTSSEVRRMLRMCPQLTSLKFVAWADDSHANTLHQMVAAEFPFVTCNVQFVERSMGQYSLVDVASRLGVPIDKY